MNTEVKLDMFGREVRVGDLVMLIQNSRGSFTTTVYRVYAETPKMVKLTSTINPNDGSWCKITTTSLNTLLLSDDMFTGVSMKNRTHHERRYSALKEVLHDSNGDVVVLEE